MHIYQGLEDAAQRAAIEAWRRGINNPRWESVVANNFYRDEGRSHFVSRKVEISPNLYVFMPEACDDDVRQEMYQVTEYLGHDNVDILLHVSVFGYLASSLRYRKPIGTIKSRVHRLRRRARSFVRAIHVGGN